MSAISNIRSKVAAMIAPPKQAPRVHTEPTPFDGASFQRAAQAFAWFYDGIRQTRDRSAIPAIPYDSADLDNSFTRREHLGIARYLFKNDGLTKGVVSDVARYTVGTGRKPQAQTEDEAVNDAYESYWRAWCFRADYYRRHHFDRLQFIWNTSETVDGDVGIVLTRDEDGDPKVQTVRGHRIGSYGDANDIKNMKDGVLLDDNDRILGFRVRVKDGKGITIPAQSFILFAECEESDSVRGISKLAHAINHVRDKKDLLSSEKTAVKTLSQFAGVLKTATGSVNEGDWNDDPQLAEPSKISIAQMQSGILPTIKQDEEILPFDFNRPSPTFTGFLEFLIREIAAGTGIPFEFLWNPSALGGTAQRFILEKAQRRFNERTTLFDNAVLTRIWGFVIGDAIQRGLLPFNKRWADVKWTGMAWLSVDAGRDQSQDRADVLAGLMPEATHAAMSGGDWRERRAQIQREAVDLIQRADAVAKETGKDFDLVLSLMRQNTSNGNSVMQSQIDAEKKRAAADAKKQQQKEQK